MVVYFLQGVESECCSSFTKSLENGEPTYVKAEGTLADGLAVPLVGVNAFATAKSLIDKMVGITFLLFVSLLKFFAMPFDNG